ncbi:MAG: hypothetical protein OHK0022_27730 [Roseiflexaceae bacterium]
MARQRAQLMLSCDPANPDVAEALAALEQVPKGQRSATLWHWAAEYLRGRARQVEATAEQSDEDLLIDLLDAL